MSPAPMAASAGMASAFATFDEFRANDPRLTALDYAYEMLTSYRFHHAAWDAVIEAMIEEAMGTTVVANVGPRSLRSVCGKRVVLEGIDGSGKSSMRGVLRKETRDEVHVDERWVGTNFVYDRFFGRVPKRQYFVELIAGAHVYDLRQIIMDVEPEDALLRLSLAGDHGYTLGELQDQRRLFRAWHSLTIKCGVPSLLLTHDNLTGVKTMAKAAAKWLADPPDLPDNADMPHIGPDVRNEG